MRAPHARRGRRRDRRARCPRSRGIAAQLAGRAMLCRRTDVFPDRVRGARLPLRLGVEGVRGDAARSPASRCRRGCARATGSTRRSSARRPRPRRATTRTSRSRAMARDARRGRRARELERLQPARVRARARASRRRAGSSSPTPSSSSGATPDGRITADRRGADAGQLALLARRRSTSPGGTQPSFDKQPLRDYLDGERTRRPLERRRAAAAAARRRWCARPASATSTRSAGSPAASS